MVGAADGQALRWRQNTGTVQLFIPLEKALEGHEAQMSGKF